MTETTRDPKDRRRTAIAGTALALLAAAALAGGPQTPEEGEAGGDVTAFTIDPSDVPGELSPVPPPPACGAPAPAGLRPTVGVLLDEGEREFRLERRITLPAFLQRHEELRGDFHLADLEIVEVEPALCLAGLWLYGPAEQRLELGLEEAALLAAHAEAGPDLQPVDVETSRLGGRRLFAAVWTEGAPQLDLALGLSKSELQDLFDAGQTVVDVESWPENRARRYLALSREATAAARLLLHLTFAELDDLLAPLIEQGYRPIELELDDLADTTHVTSVWESGDDAFWLFVGREPWQDCRIVSLGVESPRLAPVDPERCRALADPTSPLPPLTVGELLQKVAASRAPAGAALHEESLRHHPDLPLDVLELPGEPVHLVDLVFSRRSSSCEPRCQVLHLGVEHDTGPSGPGG
ncbi:MAG: hypothetical protein R3325_04050 [Thermoanaerobaculia bacterium]|nr:hypothetical protein [Thermoanaerobaculia bacterium]